MKFDKPRSIELCYDFTQHLPPTPTPTLIPTSFSLNRSHFMKKISTNKIKILPMFPCLLQTRFYYYLAPPPTSTHLDFNPSGKVSFPFIKNNSEHFIITLQNFIYYKAMISNQLTMNNLHPHCSSPIPVSLCTPHVESQNL